MDDWETPDHARSYKQSFAAYGESPGAVQWYSYDSAAIRFRELVADIEVEGKSVLDVGSGLGDLIPFLYAKTPNFRYLGVDLLDEFVEAASRKYRGYKFMQADAFSPKFNKKADVVVSSGVMNFGEPGWQDKRKQMIKKLFDLAAETVAFNMAGQLGKAKEEPKIAYANAAEVLAFCAKLTRKLVFKTHYLPDDFTIVMYK